MWELRDSLHGQPTKTESIRFKANQKWQKEPVHLFSYQLLKAIAGSNYWWTPSKLHSRPFSLISFHLIFFFSFMNIVWLFYAAHFETCLTQVYGCLQPIREMTALLTTFRGVLHFIVLLTFSSDNFLLIPINLHLRKFACWMAGVRWCIEDRQGGERYVCSQVFTDFSIHFIFKHFWDL